MDSLWVRCRECGAEGRIRIGNPHRDGTVDVQDRISHRLDCSERVAPPPAHFKKKVWAAQERAANVLVGTRETVASGAANQDGDGRAFGMWRVECKGTLKSRFLLRQDVWTKLVRGALENGEEPVLHLLLGRTGRRGGQQILIVRQELYDAYSDVAPADDASFKNPKSYRIEVSRRLPFRVALEPPGVALSRADFERIKEDVRGLFRGDTLPEPRGASRT